MTKAKPAATPTPRTRTGRSSSNQQTPRPTEVLRPAPPNQTQRDFIDSVHSNVADNLLIRRLAEEIPVKLAYNRDQGRNGWQGAFCTTEQLEDMLKDLIRKKDWIDVAIVSGMLLVRKDLYNE